MAEPISLIILLITVYLILSKLGIINILSKFAEVAEEITNETLETTRQKNKLNNTKARIKIAKDRGNLLSKVQDSSNQHMSDFEYINDKITEKVLQYIDDSVNIFYTSHKIESFDNKISIESISHEDKSVYLTTEEWKKLKQQRLRIANYKCEHCANNTNLDLHHETYIRLTNEHIDDLKILCRTCHNELHKWLGYDRHTNYSINVLNNVEFLQNLLEIKVKLFLREDYRLSSLKNDFKKIHYELDSKRIASQKDIHYHSIFELSSTIKNTKFHKNYMDIINSPLELNKRKESLKSNDRLGSEILNKKLEEIFKRSRN